MSMPSKVWEERVNAIFGMLTDRDRYCAPSISRFSLDWHYCRTHQTLYVLGKIELHGQLLLDKKLSAAVVAAVHKLAVELLTGGGEASDERRVD